MNVLKEDGITVFVTINTVAPANKCIFMDVGRCFMLGAPPLNFKKTKTRIL